MVNGWTARLDAIIDDLAPEMSTVRRHLHSHPEPSGQEIRTTAFLGERLATAGFRVRLGPGRCGLLVDTAGPHSGRLIGLRADIDALRVQEQNQSGYVSQQPGVMHACGHDAHSAILVGTLLGLARAEAAGVLPCQVSCRGSFQPAEETKRGALDMISAGALESVAAVLALHVDPSRAVGRIGTRCGPFTAACDEMEVPGAMGSAGSTSLVICLEASSMQINGCS